MYPALAPAACLPANGTRLAACSSCYSPSSPCIPPPYATTRFLFENHFVCFMDLRSLKWLRRFVCLVLLLLKILRREWKLLPTSPCHPLALPYMGRPSQVFGLGLVFVLFRRVDYWLRVMAAGNGQRATGNWQ